MVLSIIQSMKSILLCLYTVLYVINESYGFVGLHVYDKLVISSKFAVVEIDL